MATQFILMRHAEPDYSIIDKRKYKGFGNDLAPLTDKGAKQALEASKNEILDGAQLIISSPHARTTHTAAILSRALDLPLKIEVDLMEWIPDRTYSYDDYSKVIKIREYYDSTGGRRVKEDDNFEEKDELIRRIKNVLRKYTNYNKVIVVTHGMVCTALTEKYKPYHAELIPYTLD